MAKLKRWDTVEDAVKELNEHRDDFDCVVFRLADGEWKLGDHYATGAFMEIKKCDGSASLVSLEVAQELLNQGVIERLRLPVKLMPVRLTPRPEQ